MRPMPMKRTNHRWTLKELRYIKANGMKTDRELAIILGLTAQKVKACRKRHGYKKQSEFMQSVLSNITAYGGGRPIKSLRHQQSETD